ncbi:MAG: helix-turn-helix transcriptional regulator [Burkholderiales bacterium]|nr:helix-turn-helix transcriptional regulator [Burkholderiales bacterium]
MPRTLSEIFVGIPDQGEMPVAGKSIDYETDMVTPRHSHKTAQLIYALSGVLVVSTEGGQWVVPPTRGIWMPAGVTHWVRMVGATQMRTLYIRTDAAPDLPTECKAVSISPLLRELILACIDLPRPYDPASRSGRLVGLLLDELAILPTLPLSLPMPQDPALRSICDTLAQTPDDPTTLADWATQLGIDAKTIQRRFGRETGMTFGEWRQQVRVLAALEMLAGGSKIIDVALNLGYESPSAFSTMFKRQFGCAPTGFFG